MSAASRAASTRARVLPIVAIALAAAGAFGAAFPAVLRIPPRDPTARRALPAARFSHRAHQAAGCYACHPSVFPQALLGFTHTEMRDGRFCGSCHDGRVAFAITGAACKDCHVPGR